ncbi:DUF3750 domain-containing protein [Oricola cellulosilytica]|uniref:DUF3750 domain-containing protein n=1 Tax=Oricola cellulosilytica TaxID=1429082 RepID=A0A4R0PC79_9HYPH|nr:DUF3750 domain-containing protein [Oricola cellulosilytica]TCD14068.1 DUF3750 domain-containing protein [Oricola cellulosilytica]
MRMIRFIAVFILLAFLAPMAGAAAWWSTVDRPSSWRSADWSATGLLPDPVTSEDAAIYVLSARTGGFKGAFSVHSWIVVRERGATHHTRYDKVGWGSPIRRDGYDADAAWYSNKPWIVAKLTGDKAARAMPRIRTAIASYPHSNNGDYRIWPGPNSNSFVAHVLREVPELGAVLPPNAVGRDYLPGGDFFSVDPDGRDVHLSLFGLAGLSAGLRSGFEIHLLGQTAGIDILHPALKIPAFGRVGF